MSFRKPWIGTPGAIVLAMVLLAGCERNFMEVRPPINVLEPDLSFVQTRSAVDLQIETPSFLTDLRVGDVAFKRDSATTLWEGTVDLDRGLNKLVVFAFDGDRLVRTDTVEAVHLPFHFASTGVPDLPVGRGGHATTVLLDRRLLITGGAPSMKESARPEAWLYDPERRQFRSLSHTMQKARMGHTATLLPDGRVLILGGSRTDDVNSIDDLVETAELFDPTTRQFHAIPVEGAPIRRFWHTASVRNSPEGLLVDLYGGRGNVRYNPEPRLGTRSDLRTLIFRNDSLLGDERGLGLPLQAVSGHTQTPLDTDAPGAADRYLVTGSYFFDGSSFEGVSFTLDVSNLEVSLTDAAFLRTGRMRHAAFLLRPDAVLITGGHQGTPETAVNTSELYVASTDRFFRMPVEGTGPMKRFGHTATKAAPARILILGGFDTNGNGIATSEYLDVVPF